MGKKTLIIPQYPKQHIWKDILQSKYIVQIPHTVWYFVPGAFLLVAGLLLFGSAGRDDVYITYWPAYTLAHFGEMLNYNGVRVEQSSSLLQVVLLAILARVTGIEMVTLGKLSSIAFGIISVGLTAILTERITADRPSSFSAAVIVAAFPYFIYWSYGGLESTLVSLTGIFLILTVSDYSSNKTNPRLPLAVLAMILFGIVRPETPILLGCLLGGGIAITLLKEHLNKEMGRTTSSRLLKLLWIYILISAAVFTFRLWYFGDLFPQPVTAKSVGIDPVSLTNGINYVRGNFLERGNSMAFLSFVMAICLFITIVTYFKTGKFNLYLIFSVLYATGYFSFAILAGGDWMEGGRFLVHFIPVLISMIPIALAGVTRNRLHLTLIILLIAGVEFKSVIDFTQRSSTGAPLWSQIKTSRSYNASEYSWFERHSRVNMRDVYITDYFDYLITEISRHHKPVTIMSAQMGMIPYHISLDHFGSVRFIDRAGLADRTFTDCEITRNRPKGNGGMDVSYEYYFENFPQIAHICQITKPDIIFDISASDLSTELLEDNGYTIMYMQVGDVVSNEKWLEGFIVKGRHILGVRSDLLESLGKIKPVYIRLKN